MTDLSSDPSSNEYRISNETWYNRNIMKWAMYDLGNTVFSMVVVSLTIVPLLYIKLYDSLGNADDAVNWGNFAITTAVFLGNIMMAFISPFLGAYSDQKEQRRPLLMQISMLCIVLMASLVISAYTKSVIVILAIFLFANLFYQMGLVVYDAMLPFITDKDKIGRVGGLGIALGYFGSFFGIGLGFALTPFFGDFYAQSSDVERIGDNDVFTPERFEIGYIPYIFPFAALLFLLFAIPMITVKEKPRTIPPQSKETIAKEVISNVKETAGDVFNYPDMKYFLIGWLIFVDTANTVILFMTPMLQIGLEFGKGGTVLIVQAIGIMAAVALTYPVGMFVDRKGPKKGLQLVTLLWIVSLTIGVLTNLHTDF
ncbi:MAG: MFS transporter, partial [Candidatus Kariarchaeaceae archaeon]